jgi:hypothetical protein
MKKIFFGAACLLSLFACNKRSSSDAILPPGTVDSSCNKILMLKVDFETNVFEEGKEIGFPQTAATTFTTSVIDTPASDFGSVKIMYDEVNEPLFYGTITWNGLGQRFIPQSLLPASSFNFVLTSDFVIPINGYESLYVGNPPSFSYDQAWANIQGLQLVRQYLQSNPNQQVKVFLYTPSVGFGNPGDWDWYFMLKK